MKCCQQPPAALHCPESFLASHHLLTPGATSKVPLHPHRTRATLCHGPKAQLWGSTGWLIISFPFRASGIPEKYCAQLEQRAQARTAPGQAQSHQE